MKRSRIRLAPRAAVAALAVLLAACEDGISTPRGMAGHWLAVEFPGSGPQSTRVEDRLELQPDGDYTWTTITFGAGGRTLDGMLEWSQRGGEWAVDDGLLAQRITTGMLWRAGTGWSIMDFGGEWHRGHKVRREGDRLILERVIPPNVRMVLRTYNFQRVSNFDDAPPPPAGPQ